jgi:xylan 1,4-beta-xylosidase
VIPPSPLIPGFHPDPSIVRVDGVYYLVTSTFEYLPGIPIHRSTDLVDWELIGHVIERPEQSGVARADTHRGVWAPTIRHRDGVFYVIVTIAGADGCVLYRATDPTGPWSDPLPLPGVRGIDPDLAWDDAGVAIVTYSALIVDGGAPAHHGIEQVDIDLATGDAIGPARSLWSGTGLMFPEAPHLYRIGEHWYLLIAEGGTERGHTVSIARSDSPRGGFEPCPANPVLSARSTDRPIQNTGHGDLVETPDGGWAMVLLGVRTLGRTRAFSPIGRETFLTEVRWVDGWPVVEPVVARPRREIDVRRISFDHALDGEWIAVRRFPQTFADVADGVLTLHGTGDTMGARMPSFIARRQTHLNVEADVLVDSSTGSGGLAIRYDEVHYARIHVETTDDVTTVTATASLSGMSSSWSATAHSSSVRIGVSIAPTPRIPGPRSYAGDSLTLWFEGPGGRTELAVIDGRYLSAETAASFTGRVLGLFAVSGAVRYRELTITGHD